MEPGVALSVIVGAGGGGGWTGGGAGVATATFFLQPVNPTAAINNKQHTIRSHCRFLIFSSFRTFDCCLVVEVY